MITGANYLEFAETDNCSTPLAPGSNCTINVTFTPAALGIRNATLTVIDGATGSPHSVGLTGTGTGVGTVIVTFAAPSLTFIGQTVGTTSASQTVTLTNNDPVNTLAISAVTLTGANSGDFTITGQTCTSLSPLAAAGGTCTITVTFSPTATGNRNATVQVADNASDSSTPQSFLVSGAGITPVATGLTHPWGIDHVPNPVLHIVTTALPAAIHTDAYEASIVAGGPNRFYTFTDLTPSATNLASLGLTLSSDGEITGAAANALLLAGPYTFTIQVTDQSLPVNNLVVQTVTLQVN
jgi:hypothetical protein